MLFIEEVLIFDIALHTRQNISHIIIKINNAVTNVYPPINRSIIIMKGMPAMENPIKYP